MMDFIERVRVALHTEGHGEDDQEVLATASTVARGLMTMAAVEARERAVQAILARPWSLMRLRRMEGGERFTDREHAVNVVACAAALGWSYDEIADDPMRSTIGAVAQIANQSETTGYEGA